MSRKCIVCCLCLALGGAALAVQPAVQFFPPPGSNCFGPPRIQPVTVSQFHNSKPAAPPMMPVAPPNVINPAPVKPTVVEFHSSGPLPLPPLPVTPTPGSEAPPEPASAVPDDTTEATEPAPLSVPQGLYPNASGAKPAAPQTIDPDFKPAGAPQEFQKLPPMGPPEPIKPIKEPVPQPKPLEFTPPVGVDAAPWVIRVEVIKTQTHLIATSKSAEFHILCQHLKVQSPTGDIQAEGEIKVNAVGLDMECERLTISWKNDWVLLEGKVHLQTEKDGQKVEMTGDKLQLKLTSLTATSALKIAAPQLHQAAYAPPVAEIKTPGTQPVPPSTTPATVQPYYKRVTVDE